MIIKYTKVIEYFDNNQSTTHTVNAEGAVELATIDGDTYVFIPDGSEYSAHALIAGSVSVVELTDDDDLKAAIKKASPIIQRINKRVVAKIREKYDENDEWKAAHAVKEKYSEDFYTHRAECISWGQARKAEIGLGDAT